MGTAIKLLFFFLYIAHRFLIEEGTDLINVIWGILLIGGILFAAINGNIDIITDSAMGAAEAAVILSFKLIGIMCLWLGMMKLADRSGLIKLLAILLRPFTCIIFRGVPKNHPAMGAIVMTISANLLGLGNAATPLGIKAMQELQKINGSKNTASPAMCTLLALCTTGFTLVPATVIALRSAAGSSNPSEIVGVTLLVSFVATVIVLCADFICRSIYFRVCRR